MKLFTACLAVPLFLLLGSCKKDKSHPGLAGTWQIRSAQGGMTPTITYSRTNDSLLIFTDKNFTFTIQGRVVRSGTYSILDDESFNALVVPPGQFKQRIVYSDDSLANTRKIFFQLSGNELIFLSGNFALDSGVMERYSKIKQTTD